jgi:hypothetical protein
VFIGTGAVIERGRPVPRRRREVASSTPQTAGVVRVTTLGRARRHVKHF